MAKKDTGEIKMSKTDIIDKCEQCVKLAAPFVVAFMAIWGIDIAAYTAAIGLALIDILEVVKLFVK